MLLFVSSANSAEIFSGFGLPIGTKLSDIKYTEVNGEMRKLYETQPPQPMEGFNRYYVDVQTNTTPQRINGIVGEINDITTEECQKYKAEITENIKKEYQIYFKKDGEEQTIFVVSPDETGNNRIRVTCYNNLNGDGKQFLQLTYSSQFLRLPYIHSLFGVELNKKLPDLASIWKKEEWEISNYPAPKADFGFDNISLIVSPNTGETRAIIAGREQTNKETCEAQKQDLVSKLEDKFLVSFITGKQGNKLSVNDKLGLSVECRSINGKMMLGLAFYQHEYGLEPEAIIWD